MQRFSSLIRNWSAPEYGSFGFRMEKIAVCSSLNELLCNLFDVDLG